MGVSTYLSKAFLDWSLQGATPTRPAQLWIGMATSSPNASTAFDGQIQTRVSVSFAAANSPNMSATLAVAVTCSTTTSAATYVGFNLYDTRAGGNRLFWGTLTAVLGCKAGDQPAFAAGALVVVLS